MNKLIFTLLFSIVSFTALANKILVPMDETQANHMKAYGIAYWVLNQDESIDWMLNYRGGSFLLPARTGIENELVIRGVSYQVISDADALKFEELLSSPSSNMDMMKLETAPKIAVYSPKSKMPWDDAVTLALTYAEIPYDVVYDDELMNDELSTYDWLHLHHEDFTGQYGKFYQSFRNYSWYIQQQKDYEASAKKHGFAKVSQLKLAIVKKIQSFVAGGGFLFAMCSATDSFDIALAANGVDFIDYMYDGDPPEPGAESKFNFSETLAFENFKLRMDPMEYEFSDIDNTESRRERSLNEGNDYFKLFQFSAKWDPVPTMLTQNHTQLIKGFYGQTTSFKKRVVKPDVVVMGETTAANEDKYIHGIYGNGFWTFYGGHDPEDYQHRVGEEPTDLNLYPNSPGYRLILNNILFPAAKKKKRKT
ncbi:MULTISPECIES: asparagine synthetase B [Roseivirga]|uniref:Asparagine synthetase B n=1 Tax=Roseivirga spongicola TaxID=333140 RepID=A0A150X409_9BACT|nr:MULTISPECIES: asparagine synthetase B [Roseivirga]PWL24627.1 MAG: asparagine synthetase B [Roseivirga sp. XM-24bin3]KYG73437.1 asparagine synthetase B [Roseivirga spongicola]MBO6659696.1 asparagine synthetase B [Roseivirga sp.]MBO6907567.1 asparagine synthetase B [Roseivirga sp.]WPZ09940.1 asparagine synthetase B [Roseivirga spongicola]